LAGDSALQGDNMKALKFDELTLDQKLGLVSFGYVLKDSD
jgi:hypothetical protein